MKNQSNIQIILNNILISDIIGDNLQVDNPEIDKIIEQIKSLSYDVKKHDPKAGLLLIMASLWARDRLEGGNLEKKNDFQSFLENFISTKKTIN